ncbi:MAG: hypothetical protein JST79_15350 [Acidobacteria bacterium]|nr:hypothetical protein [Acidobacteriota bacterium]
MPRLRPASPPPRKDPASARVFRLETLGLLLLGALLLILTLARYWRQIPWNLR